ncbi:MAG: DUF4870 domain-containing protein [Flavobacteriaceae bacterium]|nr:DUF4870 domain-containing protein [Flavobacteriaceae bacterium]
MKKENNQLLVFTHLSQLLDFITGIGGLLIPLVLWAVNKDKIKDMDKHGRSVINFRISMFLYILIAVPMIFLFGLGILFLLVIGVFYLVFPILNAIRANNGEEPNYPLTISFL